MQKKMENRPMVYNKKLLQCIIINLCILILLMQVLTPHLQNADDHLMSVLLMGGKGSATADVVFINIILSKIIYFFCWLFPVVNWLAVYEIGLVFACFVILSYIIYVKSDNIFLTLSIIIVFCPYWYMRITFSTAAIIGGVAGFLLLLYSYENKRKRNTIIAILLIVFSFMLRNVAILGVLPMFGLAFLKIIIKNRKSLKYFLGSVFILLAGLCVTVAVNKFYYKNWNPAYTEINKARAAVIDYGLADYNDIKEQLDDIGVSENDYAMIKARVFDDYSFFDAELLNKIAQISKTQITTQTRLKETFRNYPEVWKDSCFYMVPLATCLFMLLCGNLLYIIDAFYINVVVQAYVIYLNCIVGRFPIYIKNGICFAAIGALSYAFLQYRTKKKKHTIGKKSYIIYGIITVLLFFNVNEKLIINRTSVYKQEDASQFINRISKEDKFYFVDFVSRSEWLYCRSVSVFENIPEGYYGNIIRISNWDRGLGQTNEQLARAGIDSPFQALLNDNVYLLSNESGNMDLLRIYFKEHFDIDCSYSMIEEDVLEGFNVYKFTDKIKQADKEAGEVELLNSMDNGKYRTLSLFVNVDDDSDVYLEMSDNNQRYMYMAVDRKQWFSMGEDSYVIKFVVPSNDVIMGKRYYLRVVKKSNEKYKYVDSRIITDL